MVWLRYDQTKYSNLHFYPQDCDIRISWVQINGMTCISCVNTIKNNLKDIPGFINVEIYLEDGKAFLEYDNNYINCDSIISKIDQMGFDCHKIEEKTIDVAPVLINGKFAILVFALIVFFIYF